MTSCARHVTIAVVHATSCRGKEGNDASAMARAASIFAAGGLASLVPRLAPLTSRLAPLGARLAPLGIRLAPVTTQLALIGARAEPVTTQLALIGARAEPVATRYFPLAHGATVRRRRGALREGEVASGDRLRGRQDTRLTASAP